MISLRRTVLYVPADNPRALAKARDLKADALVVDLEDAVSPERKEAARIAAREALAWDGSEVVLRVNGADTPWHAEDVALARAAGVALVLPKVRAARDVEAVAAASGGAVWPMVETAAAVLEAAAVARAAAATGPAALVLGTNDLAAELGATPGSGRCELALALQAAVLAGRAANLDILDGVFNDVRDGEGLAAEAAAARALGMTGKTIIHPGQVEIVNRAFSPDTTELAHARRVVEAFAEAERAGRSVATLDGRLVERLHVEAAQRTLARGEAIAARER